MVFELKIIRSQVGLSLELETIYPLRYGTLNLLPQI
jgi:hypothetical protein